MTESSVSEPSVSESSMSESSLLGSSVSESSVSNYTCQGWGVGVVSMVYSLRTDTTLIRQLKANFHKFIHSFSFENKLS